jgi:predicted metalloendopeptidase
MRVHLLSNYSIVASARHRWIGLWFMLNGFSVDALVRRSPAHAVGTATIYQYSSDKRNITFAISILRPPYRESQAPSVEVYAEGGIRMVLGLEH